MPILDTLRDWRDRIMTTFSTPIVGNGGVLYNSTPSELRGILAISDAERRAQELVVVARAFHCGQQGVKLTKRLREFLGPDCGPFVLRLNYVRKVNRAIAERLVLEGFKSTATDETQEAAQVAFATSVFSESRMKAKRGPMLTETVRDGEYFILIDFNKEGNIARWTPHQRFTDPETLCETHCGDGEGMFMVYPNGDVDQKPLAAVKRWTEQIRQENGTIKTESRINIYKPAQITKWALRSDGWALIEPPTEWLRKDGSPLGIPVVHVKTPDLQPATVEAIPIARGLNKAYTDVCAASDATAFQIILAFGWVPEDDQGNPLEIVPGTIMGSRSATNGESAMVVPPANLSSVIAVLDKNVTLMSDVTDVPLSLLNRSNQRAAEGTLQEEKEGFAAKIRDYQDTAEIAFEDAMKIARRLQNEFGDPVASQEDYGFGELDEKPRFETKWQPFTTRSTDEKKAEAEGLKEAGADDEEILVRVYDFTPDAAAETVRKRRAASAAAAQGAQSTGVAA